MEFVPFPKIARLNREVVITEKIDGTNAQVWVSDDCHEVRAGSRTRWITPENDNHGFARWVSEHAEELKALGPGSHFGEWFGAGIQRRYGLDHKRFALFNVHRWADGGVDPRPACCHVVPVLARGFGMERLAAEAVERLRTGGSVAVPGFMDPEGVVVFHTTACQLFKVTVKDDDVPKGLAA